MNAARLIALIEQKSEQITMILDTFRDRQITSKEVIELIVEFLLEKFCKEDKICATAQ